MIDVVDGDVLLELEWEPHCGGLLGAISASDVVIVSGVGTADRWQIQVWREHRTAVSALQDRFVENGVPAELTALRSLTPMDGRAGRVLTEAQREALAYERGYFETPRERTLEEIAEELEITRQSLGSRLRRAVNRLVEDADPFSQPVLAGDREAHVKVRVPGGAVALTRTPGWLGRLVVTPEREGVVSGEVSIVVGYRLRVQVRERRSRDTTAPCEVDVVHIDVTPSRCPGPIPNGTSVST